MRPVEHITEDNFRVYGKLIEFPAGDRNNFCIVAGDSEKPWRLAVFRYWNEKISILECHPDSMESFEPVSGTTILLVADHKTPEDYHAFLLDRPVIQKKGIWHQTLTLTGESTVKITENADVYSVFYDLPQEISVGIG